MSQICGMLKNPAITWKSDCLAKFDRPFLAHNSSFRSQRYLMLSGVECLWRWTGEPKRGVRVQMTSKDEVR
jgi:hypothetical protein